ncbi:hypothetical protein BDV06DRAFT_42128 [Aspergillus oleicola]
MRLLLCLFFARASPFSFGIPSGHAAAGPGVLIECGARTRCVRNRVISFLLSSKLPWVSSSLRWLSCLYDPRLSWRALVPSKIFTLSDALPLFHSLRFRVRACPLVGLGTAGPYRKLLRR